MSKSAESIAEGIQRRQLNENPCSSYKCFRRRSRVGALCLLHEAELRRLGFTGPAAKPAVRSFRLRMRPIVQTALLALQMPAEVVHFDAAVTRQLVVWGQRLPETWQREAAVRLSLVDEPFKLLSAMVGWALWDEVYRSLQDLRIQRPGYLTKKRLDVFRAKQIGFWLYDIADTHGFGRNAMKSHHWNKVCLLLIERRFPAKIVSVATGLAMRISARVKDDLDAIRREIQDKQAAAAEAVIRERNPYGRDPKTGNFDIFRSIQHIQENS